MQTRHCRDMLHSFWLDYPRRFEKLHALPEQGVCFLSLLLSRRTYVEALPRRLDPDALRYLQ